ncbi:NfeD family protein [Geofilum sp. OHC36d9]|uniref:NfeD family protein n=1 Tax=Geofilum sp. OHC36d9 TaxID=3458413 RepID=UPI0040340E81
MTVIILLIVTGIILLILELFVFPGITISGVGGVLMVGSAVYIAYSTFGITTGNITLFSALFISAVMLALAFRAKTWNRFMLKTEVSSTVESTTQIPVQPGDKGITITRLNPVGKIRINEIDIEGRCPDQFIDPETEVEVVKIFKTYIIVKPVK